MLSSFSHVWLFATPWTVACQATQSMGFSRQEYWSGLPCPPPGDLPDPGIKPVSQHLLHWQVDSLPLAPPGKPHTLYNAFNDCTSQSALISHASKVMLKILQARLQQYVNRELLDVQADFRKSRATRDQIANICWIIKKAREFQKNIYVCFIDYAKAFDCVDHNKLWKILKLWPT